MVLLLFFVATTLATVSEGANCSIPSSITINEGTENGTCIYQFTGGSTVTEGSFSTNPPFLHIVNDSLCFNATFNLDNNSALCTHMENSGLWTMYVTCDDGDTFPSIEIRVSLTDDFPPAFTKDRFSMNIQEMTMIGTTLSWFSGAAELGDEDCYDNLQPGVNTRFTIESGNTDEAFRLNSERTGELVVNRWLDYEHGDPHFCLNMTLANKDHPDLKSWTILEVNLLDIDDSDPVFGHPAYRLTVSEENASAVWLWLLTDPPVTVFDPDTGVIPNDTLVLSLYNSSDVSKVKVREDGAVQLQRTFDREMTPEFDVILKVQQNVSSWRSSTATLTVTLSDVNDNRPEFKVTAVTFTLAEHSPPSSLVGMLSASDRDSGDNAKFNYTLLSHEAVFTMETLGTDSGQLIGVLRVRNSSLLDREENTELDVTVGTEELTEAQGGDCTGNQCQAKVKVVLLDINDHSPAFQRHSYNVTLHDYDTNDVNITVNATDDDVGDNADVFYGLRDAGSSGGVCADVTVDGESGKVRVGGAPQRTERCVVLVEACDCPLHPENRRCSSVPLLVTVQMSNYTVTLYSSLSPNLLAPFTADIQQRLSGILGVDVDVIGIGLSSESTGSEVVISATDVTTQEMVPRHQLLKLTEEKRPEIEALFSSYRPSSTPTPSQGATSDDDFPPHVIALIVIASLLLVAFIVCLIVVYKLHKRYKRQQRLMQHLSSTSDIYVQAETGNHHHYPHHHNSSKADSDSTALILPLSLSHSPRSQQGLDIEEDAGVTNPIFRDDDDDDGGNIHEPLPRLTPRSHTDDGEEEGERERGGGDKEKEGVGGMKGHVAGRFHDADSGVPSDRENGGEEGESSSSSPALTRDVAEKERRSDGLIGSAYLAAVLRGLVTSSEEHDDAREGEVVDVTSPDDVVFTDAGLDALDGGPERASSRIGEDGRAESVRENVEKANNNALELRDPSPRDLHVLNVKDNAARTTLANAENDTTRIGFAEDKNVAERASTSPKEENSDTGHNDPAHRLAAVLHQHLMTGGEESNPNSLSHNGEKEEEEDDYGSKLGRLVRPSTPPMHRSHHHGENEDDDDADEEFMEEPEPDYAKKVRFSVQVDEMPQDFSGVASSSFQEMPSNFSSFSSENPPDFNSITPEDSQSNTQSVDDGKGPQITVINLQLAKKKMDTSPFDFSRDSSTASEDVHSRRMDFNDESAGDKNMSLYAEDAEKKRSEDCNNEGEKEGIDEVEEGKKDNSSTLLIRELKDRVRRQVALNSDKVTTFQVKGESSKVADEVMANPQKEMTSF